MAARKRSEQPGRTVTREELQSVALEALRSASALSRTQVKKALPKDYQPHHSAILDALRELAVGGRIARWQKGAVEWFFVTDPVATLGKASRSALAAGPLSTEALQKRLELETKIPKAFFQEWKKGALARGELFEVAQPPTSSGKKRSSKLLSLEPDLRAALKKALSELEKGFVALEGHGVSRERAARFLLDELGLSTGEGPTKHPARSADSDRSDGPPRTNGKQSSTEGDRSVFLDALRSLTAERRAGALLLVSELRERTPLDKSRFDRIALALAQEGVVDLHYHDYPTSLDASERQQLVRDDAGTHYVGIALRGAR